MRPSDWQSDHCWLIIFNTCWPFFIFASPDFTLFSSPNRSISVAIGFCFDRNPHPALLCCWHTRTYIHSDDSLGWLLTTKIITRHHFIVFSSLQNLHSTKSNTTRSSLIYLFDHLSQCLTHSPTVCLHFVVCIYFFLRTLTFVPSTDFRFDSISRKFNRLIRHSTNSSLLPARVLLCALLLVIGLNSWPVTSSFFSCSFD